MPLSGFEDHFGENTCLKSLGVECEVFVLHFARRRSCAESMRSPADWARPQVRNARAAEPVQLLSAAAAKVMPTKRVAVFVVHLHADSAWVSRPRMWSYTFGHPEERYCLYNDRASTREGARPLRAARRQLPSGRAGPCVWLVARLCMLVVDEEVIICAVVVGCLLCFLCVYLDAVL